MKKTNLIYSLTAILTMTFASCNNDNGTTPDTEKPTITIVSPADEASFASGSDIHADLKFSDNQELASYKVDIHSADGHTHDKHSFWSYEFSGSLSGKNAQEHLDINIPSGIQSGHYHFGVYAIDKSGNQNVVWIEIEVQ
ncbi:MAG: DUF4625 domain-containing protein [Bacteroidota bacterium]|nr:DUF4625 domain-containing protein [Bacteroidota bacterium]